jgi:hypothetical protein
MNCFFTTEGTEGIENREGIGHLLVSREQRKINLRLPRYNFDPALKRDQNHSATAVR